MAQKEKPAVPLGKGEELLIIPPGKSLFLSRFTRYNDGKIRNLGLDELGPSHTATDIFIDRVLALQIHPVTKIPSYTKDQLEAKRREAHERIDASLNRVIFPMTDVETILLKQETEHAFFAGLFFDGYQIEAVTIRNQKYVRVKTESKNPGHKNLLRNTLGTKGDVRDNKDDIRVYVPSPEYNYLLNRSFEPTLFEREHTYAAFALGYVRTHVSDKRGRMSSPDSTFFEHMHSGFNTHFGVPMGKLSTEHRPEHDLHVLSSPSEATPGRSQRRHLWRTSSCHTPVISSPCIYQLLKIVGKIITTRRKDTESQSSSSRLKFNINKVIKRAVSTLQQYHSYLPASYNTIRTRL